MGRTQEVLLALSSRYIMLGGSCLRKLFIKINFKNVNFPLTWQRRGNASMYPIKKNQSVIIPGKHSHYAYDTSHLRRRQDLSATATGMPL
jgi:hypothetical protein